MQSNKTGKITVVVADDHAIVRKGLIQIIQETKDMIIVGEAKNGREVLERLSEIKCDVLLMDMSMPDMSGLDVLKQLKPDFPNLPVLILSVHPEEQYATRVLNAGGAGYLTKDIDPEELLKAVRKVNQGGKYIGASLAEKLAYNLDPAGEKPPHEKLSDREYQVMCLIASGKTVGEIAGLIHISVKTVSTYRMRILEKMNMDNNAQLTSYAVKAALVM